MRRIWTTFFGLSLGLIALASLARADSVRVVNSLNSDWKFVQSDVSDADDPNFNDSSWIRVQIPHSWNAPQAPTATTFYRGIGWYRKHFKIQNLDGNHKYFIKFYAVSQTAEVFVNGVDVGTHAGGFTAFVFDIGSYLTKGDNVVSVKVSNAYDATLAPISADFTFFGGIYRDVELITTSLTRITVTDYAGPGVYVVPSSVTQKTAAFTVKTKIAGTNAEPATAAIETAIDDYLGHVLLTQTTSFTMPVNSEKAPAVVQQHFILPDPHLWDGRNDPFIYRVTVKLYQDGEVVDQVQQNFGLRYFQVTANNGLLLNGASLPLRGVNMHQDWDGKGWALTDVDRDTNVKFLLEIGANAVRLSHYPHAQHTLDMMDKNGIIVWAEIPLINEVMTSDAFRSSTETQLIELIRQQFNHPSIFFWSLYNEIRADSGNPYDLVDRLRTIAHREDPHRLTTGASNPSPRNAKDRHVDVLAVNRYEGWYGGSPLSIGRVMDSLHHLLNGIPLGLSEYGAGASIIQHEEDPHAPDPAGHFHPEEWQTYYHEVYYEALAQRPYVWGHFIWNLFDFSSASRCEGDRDGINDKGLVTYDRKTRKDVFYFYKAHWNPEPMVYLTSKRFKNRQSDIINIKVYSNVGALILNVNGKQLQDYPNRQEDTVTVWENVKLKSGNNHVEVIGQTAKGVIKDSVDWIAP